MEIAAIPIIKIIKMNNNPIFDLAHWFVIEVIGRKWCTADFGGTHMAHASRLIKKFKYDPDDIKACVMAMMDGMFEFQDMPDDFEFRYLTSILKGEPPYIEQFLAVPNPPPVYQINSYDSWVKEYGCKAIEEGIWDGIYLPINQPHRLTEDDIALILGEQCAQASLGAMIQYGPRIAAKISQG